MQSISPENLDQLLSAKFPPNATCWSEATDKIKDMCREVRMLAKFDESGAANFRSFDTPAKWNSEGVAATIKFYRLLDSKDQVKFCKRFEALLTA